MRDAVDRLTPLGVMVLALLREGDMHPYEILRLLRQRHHDRLVTITNGTLYHTVGRLEKAGLLGEVGVDREGNRPERTTYTLTDAGRVIVSEWVRRELSRIDRTTEFRVALAEAHNLDRLEVAELLRRRRDALGDTHQAYLRGREKARTIDTPEQFLIEVEREELLLETELRWLDTLIDRLERHTLPWGVTEIPDSHRHHALSERLRA